MKKKLTCLLAFLLLLVGCASGDQDVTPLIPGPEFYPPVGETVYDKNIPVKISSVEGAKIFYTLDGSEPTTSSTLYEEAITINHTESKLHDPGADVEPRYILPDGLLIRAIAVKEDGESIIKSKESRANYRVDKIYHRFNVQYLNTPDNPDVEGSHRLDIYYPQKIKKGKTAEVVLFVPGGGFLQVDKNRYFELANTLSGCYGYITVVMNYHVSDNMVPPKNNIFFEHLIGDVAGAFNFIQQRLNNLIKNNGKQSVRYDADVKNIHLFGQSAGATLVSLLALHPQSFSGSDMMVDAGCIKSVISLSAIYDFYKLIKFPANPLGLTRFETFQFKVITTNTINSAKKEVLYDYSPITYVKNAGMPFLILYSIEDGVGFSTQARFFHNRFKALKVGQDVRIDYFKMKHYSSDIQEDAETISSEAKVAYNILPAGHYAEVASINVRDWNMKHVHKIINFLRGRRNGTGEKHR